MLCYIGILQKFSAECCSHLDNTLKVPQMRTVAFVENAKMLAGTVLWFSLLLIFLLFSDKLTTLFLQRIKHSLAYGREGVVSKTPG